MLTPRTIPVRLPDVCHVVIAGMPPGRNVALSRRGRLGVEITSLDFGSEKCARAVIRAVNELNGVSVAAKRAMLAGAMFGWRERPNSNVLPPFDHRLAVGHIPSTTGRHAPQTSDLGVQGRRRDGTVADGWVGVSDCRRMRFRTAATRVRAPGRGRRDARARGAQVRGGDASASGKKNGPEKGPQARRLPGNQGWSPAPILQDRRNCLAPHAVSGWRDGDAEVSHDGRSSPNRVRTRHLRTAYVRPDSSRPARTRRHANW